MYNYFLFLPFASILFYLLFNNKIGVYWVYLNICLSFFIIINYIFNFLKLSTTHYLYFLKIFDSLSFLDFFLPFDILLDSITIYMLAIVLIISFLVNIYSIWYMYGDPNFTKFFLFLNFFAFFMTVLVSANNIIQIFVGWEGIGIFSYVLINFWSTRSNANRSALKAIVFNKVGDCFFYLFLICFYFIFETINIYNAKLLILNFNFYDSLVSNYKFLPLLIFFLIIATSAKSAQIFLHVWLPDAMEGPTPVSALLHAATMVTAGIFILIKFNWLIIDNLYLLLFIIVIGILTNFFASLTAIFQYDIKKIIAYSTASQLGLIFISFGLTKYNLVVFHILTHACFKALLFLLAGIIIHFCYNKQDLRFLNKIEKNLIFIYISLVLASLTLIGIPFFSAYYSKDLILQYSFIDAKLFNFMSFLFLNFSVITTSIYSFKIIYFLFWKQSSLSFSIMIKNKKFWILTFVIYLLVFLSIFIGFLFVNFFKYDFFIFSDSLSTSFNVEKINSFFIFEYSALIIVYLLLIGYLSLFMYWNYYFKIINIFNRFFLIFNIIFSKKFLFDNINFYIFKCLMGLNFIFFHIIDKFFIEKIVVFTQSFFVRKIISIFYFYILTGDFLIDFIVYILYILCLYIIYCISGDVAIIMMFFGLLYRFLSWLDK